MGIWEAIILGLIEGLTEFLPISSTGHLILASELFGFGSSDAHKAFDVIIQSGAIAAVLWHYRRELSALCRNAFKKEPQSVTKLWHLFLAFLPAAVVGLLLGKTIKAHLFGLGPVIAAMIVGGVALIFIERWKKKTDQQPTKPIHENTNHRNEIAIQNYKQALGIGLFQCLAMWPGTSRSMATILGGRLLGLNNAQATTFSFYLAIPTLLAAAGYDALKHHAELLEFGMGNLVAGTLTSFVVALLVIRGFLKFISKYSLEVFGWYRVALGLILLLF